MTGFFLPSPLLLVKMLWDFVAMLWFTLEEPAPDFAGSVISLSSRSSGLAAELPTFQVSCCKPSLSSGSHTTPSCSLQPDAVVSLPWATVEHKLRMTAPMWALGQAASLQS